jgi:hypothetical protein
MPRCATSSSFSSMLSLRFPDSGGPGGIRSEVAGRPIPPLRPEAEFARDAERISCRLRMHVVGKWQHPRSQILSQLYSKRRIFAQIHAFYLLELTAGSNFLTIRGRILRFSRNLALRSDFSPIPTLLVVRTRAIRRKDGQDPKAPQFRWCVAFARAIWQGRFEIASECVILRHQKAEWIPSKPPSPPRLP